MTEVGLLLREDPAKKAKQFQAVIGKLGNKIERLEKNILSTQRPCHSCRQVIAEEVKTEYITGANTEVAEYTKAVADAKKLMASQEQTIAELLPQVLFRRSRTLSSRSRLSLTPVSVDH